MAREIDPAAAQDLLQDGAVLVDIRDSVELIDGTPRGAINVPMDQLSEHSFDPGVVTIFICASGRRSLIAATDTPGLRTAYSVRGGYEAWRQAGLPEDRAGLLSRADTERYRRQLVLSEVGIAGQNRLAAGKVLVIGAGGLGSPALTYLAAAGVGRLGIVDDDRVDRSNLQRQILHRDDRVGDLKTESARRTLQAINPRVEVVLHTRRLVQESARELIAAYDVVVDGSDNLATRYVLNRACVSLARPLVYGAVLRFSGQVSLFWPAREGGACYNCLFPDITGAAEQPNCAEAGVLGAVPAVVGSLQAIEVLKILLGVGRLLSGRLLRFNALDASFSETRVRRDPGCPVCGSGDW